MTRVNRKRLIGLVFLSVASLFLGGCSVKVADLALVSTKNIDLSNTHLDARNGQRQKGKDCSFTLRRVLPLGMPNMEDAVDKALAAGKGNILLNAVATYQSTWLLIGTLNCIEVEGTVLNVPAPATHATITR